MQKTTRKKLWKLSVKTFQMLDSAPRHELTPKTNPLATKRTWRHPRKRQPLPILQQMKLEFRNWNRIRAK